MDYSKWDNFDSEDEGEITSQNAVAINFPSPNLPPAPDPSAFTEADQKQELLNNPAPHLDTNSPDILAAAMSDPTIAARPTSMTKKGSGKNRYVFEHDGHKIYEWEVSERAKQFLRCGNYLLLWREGFRIPPPPPTPHPFRCARLSTALGLMDAAPPPTARNGRRRAYGYKINTKLKNITKITHSIRPARSPPACSIKNAPRFVRRRRSKISKKSICSFPPPPVFTHPSLT